MPGEKRMINDDGGLNVEIKCKDVTWFTFKDFSRILNSKQGGWNSISNWREWALLPIIDKEWSGQWTVNSLTAKKLPDVRKENFMFSRHPSKNRIQAAGSEKENGLNIDLFTQFCMDSECGIFDNQTKLIGYEIPLSYGQLRVDLVGVTNEFELNIIELKAADGKDSPLMALVELICYAVQFCRIVRSKNGKFWSELEDEINPIKIKKEMVHLTIAAPEKYWDYRHNDKKIDRICTVKHLDKIVQTVSGVLKQPLKLHCYSLKKEEDKRWVANRIGGCKNV